MKIYLKEIDNEKIEVYFTEINHLEWWVSGYLAGKKRR